MRPLNPEQGYKPLDFGAGGITGSIDAEGRMIALNSYHPDYGYITLTTAPPFPDDQRYNPAAVRAYRASLVNLRGFGFEFAESILEKQAFLMLADTAPHIKLNFENGGMASVTTLAVGSGIIQRWEMHNVTPRWSGIVSLQRCAYTQLTEGGPIPAPAVESVVHFENGVLTIENPATHRAVAIAGFASEESFNQQANGAVEIEFHPPAASYTLAYAFGETAYEAAANASRLLGTSFEVWLQRCQTQLGDVPRLEALDPLVRRGLIYSAALAVPVGNGTCLLTDHMLLPLHWNRDAYYLALALLYAGEFMPQGADIVRRHLIWMFEQADRVDGFWGRSYMANGRVKDPAFQLDQQLFPLLELAQYTQVTGDRATFAQLEPHLEPLIKRLMERKAPDAMLFPTDETPADDPIALPYHLSSHVLFWYICTLFDQLGVAGNWAQYANDLCVAIETYFAAEQKIYAYATDGKGRFHFYHDANDIPFVLASQWGLVSADNPVWRATLDFAFSDVNEHGFYDGHLGSVHTRAPWPLGDVQERLVARIFGDTAKAERAFEHLHYAAQWDGALPEAYHAEMGDVASRAWFAWPNAALACLELGAFGV